MTKTKFKQSHYHGFQNKGLTEEAEERRNEINRLRKEKREKKK